MNKSDLNTLMEKLHDERALPRRDHYTVLCPDESSAANLRDLLAATGMDESFAVVHRVGDPTKTRSSAHGAETRSRLASNNG